MEGDFKFGADVKGAFGLAIGLTVVAALVDDGTLGLLVGLIVFVLAIYCMFRVPLRYTLFTLTFLVLSLPNRGEGQPTKWPPPFTMVGAVLFNHLNTIDRSLPVIGSIPLSGLDLTVLALVLVNALRRSSGSKLDSAGRIATPKPLVQLAQLAIAAGLFTWFSGLVRGGDFGMSLWQVGGVIYLPAIFLLWHVALRGPRDHSILLRILLAAAVYKCLLATYVVHTIVMPADEFTGSTKPAYGTSHSDSMLFALAFVVILAAFVEGAPKRMKWFGALLLPILFIGTHSNNRRLAWVQVALVFITVYLVSRETPLKRKFRRFLLLLVPVIAIYLMAGWDSQYGSLFKPARIMRSVVDAKSDGSSRWREWENVNLIATFRHNAIFGSGFGHPFEEVIVLPTVEHPLERYAPHNSLLGVWSFGGLVGYAGLTLLWMGGVFFAMRSYYRSPDREHRIAALVSFAAVLIYMLQAWGDLGLGTPTGIFLVAPALAAAGKLATANGEWKANGKQADSRDRRASTAQSA